MTKRENHKSRGFINIFINMSQFLFTNWLQFYLLFLAESMINKYHVRPVVQNEGQELDMHFKWFFDAGSAIPRQIAVLVVLQIVWNANIIYVDCDMAHFTEYLISLVSWSRASRRI